MHLGNYLALIHRAEGNLAGAFRQIAREHGDEPDVEHLCLLFAGQCDGHVQQLQPFVDRYGERKEDEPERLHSELFRGTRQGSMALLRDLHDLYLMAQEADICWTVIKQAAQGLQDQELESTVQRCEGETTQQYNWLRTRMKQSAPQTLIVASA